MRFPPGLMLKVQRGTKRPRKQRSNCGWIFSARFRIRQKNATNQSAWEEEAQLIGDSLKYGGDRTLDAAAMYWGTTHLALPVISPQELLAQAKTIQAADQPGDRAFDERMASYLAVRFDSLNRLASYYHSATDAIVGRGVPLKAADLQAATSRASSCRSRGT
jgi:hypothetical protein